MFYYQPYKNQVIKFLISSEFLVDYDIYIRKIGK